MHILINGQEAVLKKGTSFEYISENRLFTGSDAYTLSITFPLKDCSQNQRIFGFINRADVPKMKVVFDCEIINGSFDKVGSLVITKVDEREVKAQFLEGRSEQNFDASFDDIYINKLSLGYAPSIKKSDVTVSAAWNFYPYSNWVALPWVNNTSGVLHNGTLFENMGYSWENTADLSFQPYLLYILKKLCEVLGYTGDFTPIENSQFRFLVFLNCLPPTWYLYDFAAALPHWSVTEFFEELEKLMNGHFEINHKAKTISFSFTSDEFKKLTSVTIDKVVNAYQTEVTMEDKSDYVGSMRKKYADNDNRFWAYRSCQWYIDQNKENAHVFETFNELKTWAQGFLVGGVYPIYNRRDPTVISGWSYCRGYGREQYAGNALLYCQEYDTYFVMYNYKTELVESHTSSFGDTYNYYRYYYRIEPVNQFGDSPAEKDAEEVELKIVPAWIDDTDDVRGTCVFLECGEMGDAAVEVDTNGNVTSSSGGTGSFSTNQSHFGGRRSATRASFSEASGDYNDGGLCQPNAGRAISEGEQDKSDAYFDCIYVGFWDGTMRYGKLQVPYIDCVAMTDITDVRYMYYSLRLNGTGYQDRNSSANNAGYLQNIDGKKKYTFSFISDNIPNPLSVFFIRGQRYVCEKITAKFTEKGMSQLIKGTFYRIMD